MLRSRSLNATVPPMTPGEATKDALLSVVQVWLDRIQAMAVITSFFVSIDSMIYSFPSRPPQFSAWSKLDLLISASLGGAIILHVCASILAYIASFFLIRYHLSDAEEKEHTLESSSTAKTPPTRMAVHPSASAQWDAYINLRSLVSVRRVSIPHSFLCGTASRKRRVNNNMIALTTCEDAAAPLRSMVTMLTRCHTAITIMTQLGFILALLGMLAYFWTGLPQALAIWATTLLGGCLFGMSVVVV